MQVKTLRNVSGKDFRTACEYLKSIKAQFNADTKTWTIAEGFRKNADGAYYIAEGSPLAANCPDGKVFKTYGKNSYPCDEVLLERFLFEFGTVEVLNEMPQDAPIAQAELEATPEIQQKSYRVSYPSDTCREWQLDGFSPREAADKMARQNGCGAFVTGRMHGTNYIASYGAGTGAGMNRQTTITVYQAA